MKLKVDRINRYGTLIFKVNEEEMFDKHFSFGDLVEIIVNDKKVIVPFCLEMTAVLPGNPILHFEYHELFLGILNGDFASTYGFAGYYYEDDEMKWHINNNDYIDISIKEKGAYLNTLKLMYFERTYNRNDYDSDEIYGNFRKINNNLYRSSHPLNNALKRNEYVDKLLKDNNIKTIINLTDSNKRIENISNNSKSIYYKELYKQGNVLPLNTNADLISENFRKKISEGLKFIIDHDSPYLIHCLEGKDRTGYVIFLLMSLLNYSLEDITIDYLKTYECFYHLKKDSDSYNYLKDNALKYFLKCINYDGISLYNSVRNYLLLSDEEMDMIINKLEDKND